MEQIQQQLNELQEQVKAISDKVNDGDHDLEEMIRDTVTYDRDVTTPRSSSVFIPSGGGSATVPKIPDMYLRIWFRGKLYNVPAHIIT